MRGQAPARECSGERSDEDGARRAWPRAARDRRAGEARRVSVSVEGEPGEPKVFAMVSGLFLLTRRLEADVVFLLPSFGHKRCASSIGRASRNLLHTRPARPANISARSRPGRARPSPSSRRKAPHLLTASRPRRVLLVTLQVERSGGCWTIASSLWPLARHPTRHECLFIAGPNRKE